MIEHYEKFRIPDEHKENDFFIEVNWDQNNKKINKCKILKFTFPDGKTAYVKKEYLNAVLFAIGSEKDQRKMIPQKITRVRWYETVLSVKAKKDIRKGENITFPIKLSLPPIEEEVISELKKDFKKKII